MRVRVSQDLSGQLEGIGSCSVLVGSVDSEDDGRRVGDVLEGDLADLLLDVGRLIARCDLGEDEKMKTDKGSKS